MPLQVDLVSPERVMLTVEADMVVTRTTEGDIAFQPGHVSFVGNLLPGMVKVFASGGGVHHIAVHRGFVEISRDRIAILSDIGELDSEIDADRAAAAAERARSALLADANDEQAADALRRAEVRLAVAAAAE